MQEDTAGRPGTEPAPHDTSGELVAQLRTDLHLRPGAYSPLGMEPDESVEAVTNGRSIWERVDGGWKQTVNGHSAPELNPRAWRDLPALVLVDASHDILWSASGARFLPGDECGACTPAGRVAEAAGPLELRQATP